MKNSAIFLKDYIDFNIVPLEDFTESEILNDIEVAMVKFAKMHVQKALKEACEEVYIDWEDNQDDECFAVVNKSSILNAYPLENIK